MSAVEFVLGVPEEKAFNIEKLDYFYFSWPKGLFANDICDSCGEVVFERYLRVKDGKQLFIPCSTYNRNSALR